MKGKETKGTNDKIPTLEDLAKDLPTMDEIAEMFEEIDLDTFAVDMDDIPAVDVSDLETVEIQDLEVDIPEIEIDAKG